MQDAGITYREMRQMLVDLQNAGGFSPDEPLDSTTRIRGEPNSEPLKSYQIGSYASATVASR